MDILDTGGSEDRYRVEACPPHMSLSSAISLPSCVSCCKVLSVYIRVKTKMAKTPSGTQTCSGPARAHVTMIT